MKNNEKQLIKFANKNLCPQLKTRGGGVTKLRLDFCIKTKTYCLYVYVNVLEAMGANMVNTILEGL